MLEIIDLDGLTSSSVHARDEEKFWAMHLIRLDSEKEIKHAPSTLYSSFFLYYRVRELNEII